MSEPTKTRILSYLELIKRKPKTGVKFFWFDGDTKSRFVVVGSMLKLLPLKYHRMYHADEFYVQVDVDKEEVIYYAFDLENYLTSQRANEVEGKMQWSEVETIIHNFLTVNIKELTDVLSPHAEAFDTGNKTASYNPSNYDPYSNNNRPVNRPENNHNYGSTYSPPAYSNNYSNFNSAAYKEREAFYDRLNTLLKENKTSKALDHTASHLEKMCQEKKFEELDTLLRLISFDKLSIPVMLGILETTKQADKELKARSEFFGKVKSYLGRIKPNRSGRLLKDLEPA